MKKSISRSAPIPLALFIISAVCLLPAVSSSAKSQANPFAETRVSDQRAGCEAAIKRVQKAVTEEAYAFVAARRAGCQFASLPADSRAGKPQAIYKLTQQKYEEARQEVAAAYHAAGDCGTSGIEKPRIFETAEDWAASYLICLERDRVSCSGLQPVEFLKCESENDKRREARGDTCEQLIEKLDCEGLHVVDDHKPLDASAMVEEVVTAPDDLDPKCREAYLQFKAAEKEQEHAQKRVVELAPRFGGAGPRGQALYDRASADSRSAQLKRDEAEQNLNTCQGLAGADREQPGKPKRSCNPAIFNLILGTWQSDYGPVTFEGSCDRITGYWVQDASKRGQITGGSFDSASRTLSISYKQSWNNVTEGKASFTLSADGSKLDGRYSGGGGDGYWRLHK